MDIKHWGLITIVCVLVVAVASVLAVSGPAAADPPPEWSEMDSGTGAGLWGIWGASPTDILAAGGGGTIVHYNGSSWGGMTSGTTDPLFGVWGTSSSDVYAVGFNGILHYNGSGWSQVYENEYHLFWDVWGSSSTDVYAADGGDLLLNYNGSAWNEVDYGTTESLGSVWGSSSDEVFIGGDAGFMRYFNGSDWSDMSWETECDIADIWGSSSSDVFAVGADVSSEEGIILHYNGSAWSEVYNDSVELYGVWGNSSSDVYAVGSGGTILHYDGDTWSTESSGTTADLRGIWGSTSGDIFVSGEDGTILYYDTSWGWEYYQKGSVDSTSCCGNLSGYQVQLDLHYGSGSSNGRDVYLNNGSNSDFSDVRFTEGDGTTLLGYWIEDYTENDSATVWVNFSTISTSGTDFYIYYGNPNASPISDGDDTFIFFDDFDDGEIDTNKWTEIYEDNGDWVKEENGILEVLGQTSGFGNRADIWSGFLPSDVNVSVHTKVKMTDPLKNGNKYYDHTYCVANTYYYSDQATRLFWRSGYTWHNYDQWQSQFNGGGIGVGIPSLNTTYHVLEQWMELDKKGYVVVDGTEYIRTTTVSYDPSQTEYLRVRIKGEGNTNSDGCVGDIYVDYIFVRKHCNPEPTISWFANPLELFSVGADGVVVYYNGSEWAEMNSSTSDLLMSVWGSSPSDVFAVGNYGTIVHYNGSEWSGMDSGTEAFLWDVWGSSSSDVFAVSGANGVVLHYNGSEWSDMDSGTEYGLGCVWGTASDDVFAGGDEGVLLHYNGSAWSEMNSSAEDDIADIWGSSSSDVYAVSVDVDSDESIILHYNGSAWSEVYNDSVELYGVLAISSDAVFVTGDEGTIVKYNGSEWADMDSGVEGWLWKIWGASESNVFTAGADGSILHYDGCEWAEMSSSTSEHLYGIWGSF